MTLLNILRLGANYLKVCEWGGRVVGNIRLAKFLLEIVALEEI
jgi:hypothetical protein